MEKIGYKSEVLSDEELKRVLDFLSKYKFIEDDEKLKPEEIYQKNDKNFHYFNNLETIKKETWLDLEIIYLMLNKIEKFNGYRTGNMIFSSDSSVFRIKWKNSILKLYYHLWKEIIEKYHKIQNKLAEKEYEVNCEWKINWKSFKKVIFNIHSLPENEVYWDDNSSFSIIPEIKKWIDVPNNLTNDNYIRKNLIPYLEKEIIEKNNLNLAYHLQKYPENKYAIVNNSFLDSMNLSFQKIENETLFLTITDLWERIEDFLEYFEEKKEIKEKRSFFKRIISKLLP